MRAVGFAVAGGRSARMARDKALLPWRTSTLLDHTVARLREVCTEVRILSGPEPRYEDRGLPVLTDRGPDLGPLAGLEAALDSLQPDEVALLLAVDLPLVPVPLLRHLLAALTGFDAAIPVSAHGPEPLVAAYGAACLPAVRAALDSGQLKMTMFWPHVRVREIGAPELAPFGSDALRNVNRPEDLAAVTPR